MPTVAQNISESWVSWYCTRWLIEYN